jgi:hypothetical protein
MTNLSAVGQFHDEHSFFREMGGPQSGDQLQNIIAATDDIQSDLVLLERKIRADRSGRP